MRARSHVYHVDCFRCVACGRQLVPGDQFALADDGLLCRVDHDLAVDQQLQCAGGGPGAGGGGAASLKGLALSPPDSVTSDDIGFAAAACNNNNNNNNGETTTNNVTGRLYPRPIRGHFGIARSVRLSVIWRICLCYRHAGCLQLSHHRLPEMCGLWTRPRTDVDPPRFMDRTAIGGGGHIVSPPPGDTL